MGKLSNDIANYAARFSADGQEPDLFTVWMEKALRLEARIEELEKRLEAAETRGKRLLAELRQTCWRAYEGYNALICDLCDAKIPDGLPQAERDKSHLPECLAALAGKEKR